ncbi:SCO7613 C-terminal domain-containing membrane protein [Actinoplanes sp. N902-109]|uniref:SCO7613 C-terminal domain-containing membrane protein n=1 Tax=Actinoplanes sp. (strain N902-109) TaxID=649831 RepID=UPI0003293517|nr:hypothetical protein [Actinoplanes sp. N902-109]AGL15857.1 hypothetical protein L083_2347 [Actinoplanes sp. N902-109]
MIAYPCPFCRSQASSDTGCPGCGRGPDADAAEVLRLDLEIPVLQARLTAADTALRSAWARRETAAARVRATVAAAARTAPQPSSAPAMTAPVTTATAEASTRLMQNTLFTLGGLLLAVAAIVFTAVAWSQFGVKGRAGLLGAATVVALAAPLLALRRNLRSTAETFAAVGLLLVLLDGYAAWYVNLFGLAGTSALGYAGAVFAVTAAIAAGYEHLTGLTGPRYAALLLAQPVLPLLAAPWHPGPAGWSFTMSAVAVLLLLRRRTWLTRTLAAVALALAAVIAMDGLIIAQRSAPAAWSAVALLVTALLTLPLLTAEVTAGVAVVALAVGGSRLVSVAFGGFPAPVLVALVVTGLAVGAALTPVAVRRGARIGALTALAVPMLVALTGTAVALVTGAADWRLPVVLALLSAGVVVLLPRLDVVLAGVALLGLAAPAGFAWPWWTAVPLDLAVLAGALVLAARRTRWVLAVAVLLAAHAVAVAAGTPGLQALTLTAVVAAGVGCRRTWFADPALAVAVLVLPAVAWQAGDWFGWSAVGQGRAALAVLAALVVPAHRNRFAFRAVLALLVTVPGWALASGDAVAVYAAVGLLMVAALTPVRDRLLGVPAVLLGFAVTAAIARDLSVVYLLRDARVAVSSAMAVGLTAAAVAAGVWVLRGRREAGWAALPVVVLGVPLAVAAGGAPWPSVSLVSLVTGLAALVVAGVRPGRPALVPVATAVAGALAAGAGLAGAVATDALTLVAFGLIVVAGAAVGVTGRTGAVRIAGWPAAAVAAVVEAGVASRTGGLAWTTTAFTVLATAAGLLALGTVLGRKPEGRALQAAAHGGAVVALALMNGSLRYTAAVCTLWGVALGVRALLRDRGAARAHLIAACTAELVAAWLLLASAQVAVVEAYTIPAATVALLAGGIARRGRNTAVPSWIAYGPALAAALLPTLVTVLVQEGEPLRRLLLGLAALAVTVAGAQARLRAPVVAGGVTLAVVALHEAILVWDLLPRWIPLAAAGLLLVGLAMTLERRRRDMARLRAALTRMS